jgi:cytochrome P450
MSQLEIAARDLAEVGIGDLLQPQILNDPYPLFRRLRNEDPVHCDPSGRGWMVTRYEDAQSVLSDRRFSAQRTLMAQKRTGASEAVMAALAQQMLFMDPPDHTRLRRLFARAFTPARMEALRPQIVTLVGELLQAAQAHGDQIDFVQDFAVPLPVGVIAGLFGVPAQDHVQMRQWSIELGKLLGGRELPEEESREAQFGVMAFVGYLRDLIEQRRHRPADDLISGLVEIEEQGDRLSNEELIVNLMLLLAAGHATTTHLLGNGLLALLRHPQQWQRLVQQADVTPAAVNELLRFDGPVLGTAREALEEVTLHDRVIRKGDRVSVLLGAANRDERQFDDPDQLDLGRSTGRLLSFGHGVHTCLGAALARLEAQIAFTELARRYPYLTITDDSPPRNPSIAFRGLMSLPVRLRG